MGWIFKSEVTKKTIKLNDVECFHIFKAIIKDYNVPFVK